MKRWEIGFVWLRAYGNMGLVYYSKGQLDDALQYHKKALEIHQAFEERVGMAIEYGNIGASILQ